MFTLLEGMTDSLPGTGDFAATGRGEGAGSLPGVVGRLALEGALTFAAAAPACMVG